MIFVELIILILISFLIYCVQRCKINKEELTIKQLKRHRLIFLANITIATITFLSMIILLIVTATIYE